MGNTQCRGVGQQNDIIAAALLIRGVCHLGFQYAHNGILLRSDFDGLAHGIAAIGHTADVIAHYADLLVVSQIHVVDAAPDADGAAAHSKIALAHALDAGVAVAGGTHLHGPVDAGRRRHRLEQVRVGIHEAVNILHFHRAGTVTHDLHADDVGAEI